MIKVGKIDINKFHSASFALFYLMCPVCFVVSLILIILTYNWNLEFTDKILFFSNFFSVKNICFNNSLSSYKWNGELYLFGFEHPACLCLTVYLKGVFFISFDSLDVLSDIIKHFNTYFKNFFTDY